MANDHTTPIIILSKLYNNKNKTFRRLYYRLYHRLRHRLCHHFCVVSVISTIVPVVSASSISLSPHRLRRCLRVVSIVTSSHRPSISCLSIYESSRYHHSIINWWLVSSNSGFNVDDISDLSDFVVQFDLICCCDWNWFISYYCRHLHLRVEIENCWVIFSLNLFIFNWLCVFSCCLITLISQRNEVFVGGEGGEDASDLLRFSKLLPRELLLIFQTPIRVVM